MSYSRPWILMERVRRGTVANKPASANLPSADTCCFMRTPPGDGPATRTRASALSLFKNNIKLARTLASRSEERRVGKECRTRWWVVHNKKELCQVVYRRI